MDELNKRRQEQRYLRCSRSGCWITRCPLLPARRPQGLSSRLPVQGKETRPQPVLDATIEEIPNSDGSDSEESKD